MEHVERPHAIVLPESALVPAKNQRPPPARFTHRVVAGQPYHYSEPSEGAQSAGRFAAGTQVELVSHERGPMCWVIDGRGLYVATAHAGLEALGRR